MDNLSLSQAIMGLSAAGGGVVVLIRIATFVAKELDARRQRIEDRDQKRLEASVEARRLTLDYSEKGERNTVTELWKLVDDKDEEIKDLEAKLKDAERAERLNRPTIMRIFHHVRAMRSELDHLNLLVLGEEETNIFMTRFRNTKEILGKIEGILSGDETDGTGV